MIFLVSGVVRSLWYIQEKLMQDGGYDVILKGNEYVAGPGHNAEIITDDANNDWLIYHGYLREDPGLGRLLFMDKILWSDGWPYIENGTPSLESDKPIFLD